MPPPRRHRRRGFDEANPITPLRRPRRKASISHEEAATVPVVGVTAWRWLIQKGRLKPASSSFGDRKLTMTASDSANVSDWGTFISCPNVRSWPQATGPVTLHSRRVFGARELTGAWGACSLERRPVSSLLPGLASRPAIRSRQDPRGRRPPARRRSPRRRLSRKGVRPAGVGVSPEH